MPVEVSEAMAPEIAAEPRLTKRWTRAECEAIARSGLLEGQRLELIDGELIDKKMGRSDRHILAVFLMHRWLAGVFGFDRVKKEDPIDVRPEDNPANGPEPDLVVLHRSFLELPGRPKPLDIAMAIEVAGSTLALDLNKKGPLYARAGIPEYWVLDINERRLFVHRKPARGKYRSVQIFAEHESVSPLAAPGPEFRVGQAFQTHQERG